MNDNSNRQYFGSGQPVDVFVFANKFSKVIYLFQNMKRK